MNILKWKKTATLSTGLFQHYTTIENVTYVIHEGFTKGKLAYFLLNKSFKTLEQAKAFVPCPAFLAL